MRLHDELSFISHFTIRPAFKIVTKLFWSEKHITELNAPKSCN